MRHILLGQIFSKKINDFITKVLSFKYEEFTNEEMLCYVEEILSHHVNKLELKEILSDLDGKHPYRVSYDQESKVYTIIEATPALVYGTYKTVIARIWTQQMDEDVLPEDFANN